MLIEAVIFIAAAAAVELAARILLGLRFGTFGKKRAIDVIRYPLGTIDWRVFDNFGAIRARDVGRQYRFSTQAEQMGMSEEDLMDIMARANGAHKDDVTRAYMGSAGFEQKQYRPFVGFGNRPNQELSYAAIDALGFQGDYTTTSKKPGVKRALLLGGSTAFGFGALAVKGNLTTRLQEALNEKEAAAGSPVKWEVINLAFVANQSLGELNQSLIYSSLLSPDMIIQLSGINDIFMFVRPDRLNNHKLYSYHNQQAVIDYLETPLRTKIADSIVSRVFTLRILHYLFRRRTRRRENQLYTIW